MNRLSKCFVSLSCLWMGACQSERFQHEVLIVSPPPLVSGESGSSLQVPKKCSVYAPGGGDVDTPEAPFPDGFSIICAVDDTGASYGIVNGDAPTARPAILPGQREIGLYFGFQPGSNLADRYTIFEGATADIVAYSAPQTRLAIRPIASGPTGLLLGLGQFDSSATHVAGSVALTGNLAWAYGFYVNGVSPDAP